jgi:hypothetical protein
MNENVEVRFSRLERAPAYKTVSDAILKDIIGGRLRIGCRVKRSSVCTENSILIDYVTESPNVTGDDRSVMFLPGPVRLAVQVEEPT